MMLRSIPTKPPSYLWATSYLFLDWTGTVDETGNKSMLMVVDPLKTKLIERAPNSRWRRLDRSFVADLYFQEHGWLKDGLAWREKGRA